MVEQSRGASGPSRCRFGLRGMAAFPRVLSIALALMCVGEAEAVGAARAVRVDPSIQYQTIQGFGTDLAWWANLVGGWGEPARSEVMDLVFDRERGLGFTIVRYNIGGGENPECSRGDHMSPRARIEGFRPAEGAAYDWTADANQRWVLEHCKEAYGIRDFEANAVSPPWWMTVSGCTAGAETPATPNLKEDYCDDFADYLVEVAKHFREAWGVTFNSLSPFNEPLIGWWVKGSPQEGCCYTRPLMDRVVRELGARLREAGLPTTVCSPDEYDVGVSVESYKFYGALARSHVGAVSTHSYQGSLTDRYAFRDLLLSEGKAGMMSEVCHAGRPEGHTHTGMRCALEMAWQMTTDLRDLGAAKWVFWEPVIDEFYNVNDVWGANDNWGPIHARFTGPDAEKVWIAKEFYGIAHYSRFIRPGYVIVETDDPRTLAAYEPAAGELVIVAYNEGEEAADYVFDIALLTEVDGLRAVPHRTTTTQSLDPLPPIAVRGGAFPDRLPPQSITTYVIGGVRRAGPRRRRINDKVTGAGEGQFDYHGAWEYTRQQTATAPWMSVLEADYYEGYEAGPYSKDAHRSCTAGHWYAVRFRGGQIEAFGPTGDDQGIAAISVDGGPEVAVDCYSAERRDRVLLYSSGALADGRHELKVRVTGERNPKAGGAWVSADEVLISAADAHAPGGRAAAQEAEAAAP